MKMIVFEVRVMMVDVVVMKLRRRR